MADSMTYSQISALATMTAKATIAASLIQARAIDIAGVLDVKGEMDRVSLLRLKTAVDSVMAGVVLK